MFPSYLLHFQKSCSINLIQDNAKTHDPDLTIWCTLHEERHSHSKNEEIGASPKCPARILFSTPRRSKSYPINRWESEPTTATTRTTNSNPPNPNKGCNMSRIHKDHAPVLKRRSPSFNTDCPSAAAETATASTDVNSPCPPSGLCGRCSTGQGDVFRHIATTLVRNH
jgi:hypothetical protein